MVSLKIIVAFSLSGSGEFCLDKSSKELFTLDRNFLFSFFLAERTQTVLTKIKKKSHDELVFSSGVE